MEWLKVKVEDADEAFLPWQGQLRIDSKAPAWRRAWFLVTFLPCYLFTGEVRLP